MRKKDLEMYLNNVCTKDLLELIQEHRDASFKMVTESMMNINSVRDIDLCKIAEYRGQVQALDLILDLEEFLSERLDKEVRHEDIDSIRP